MSGKWLTRTGLFFLLTLVLRLLSGTTNVDLDVYHEMALVREAIQIGRIPYADVFAYTPTVYPVVHHEWGSGAVLYLSSVASGLGGGGLLLLKYTLFLLISIGCYVGARRRGAPVHIFLFLAPIAVIMVCLGFSTIRAQVFTLGFLTCMLLFFTQKQRSLKWLVAWLALYLLWLNMHAGFLVGLGLFGVESFERWLRELLATRSVRSAFRATAHLWLALSAMVVLIPVNPFGLHYIAYLARAVSLPRPLVLEWLPLWQAAPTVVILFYALSLVPVLYLLVRQGPRQMHGILILLVSAWFAFQHTRHVSIYAVVWLILVPAWMPASAAGRMMDRIWTKHGRILCAVWLVIGAAQLYSAWTQRFWELQVPAGPDEQLGIKRPFFPVGAVAYLDQHGFEGNLMVYYNYGSYVSWKLYPAVRISLDSRYEVAYPPQWTNDVVAFYKASPGWQETLSRYPTDAVLVRPAVPIAALLDDATDDAGRQAWTMVYRDDAFLLYLRQGLEGQFPRTDRRGQQIIGTFP